MSVPPLHHLASLTLRNGPEAPGVEVGDSKYFPRQIGLIHGPAAIPLLALGKAASDSGPRPQAPPPSRPSAPGSRSGPLPSPLQLFPSLAPGCLSHIHARPESGILPSWGHLSPRTPPTTCRSLEKVGREVSEARMPGFLPGAHWNRASPTVTPSLLLQT